MDFMDGMDGMGFMDNDESQVPLAPTKKTFLPSSGDASAWAGKSPAFFLDPSKPRA